MEISLFLIRFRQKTISPTAGKGTAKRHRSDFSYPIKEISFRLIYDCYPIGIRSFLSRWISRLPGTANLHSAGTICFPPGRLTSSGKPRPFRIYKRPGHSEYLKTTPSPREISRGTAVLIFCFSGTWVHLPEHERHALPRGMECAEGLQRRAGAAR